MSLQDRYKGLVSELEAEGFPKANVTELLHALMHFGPADTDEAKELLRRWRRVQAEL